MLGGEPGQVADRGEDLDVGVEIEHRSAGPLQQMGEEPRLHRGGELEDRIDGGHLPPPRAAEPHVIQRKNGERLPSAHSVDSASITSTQRVTSGWWRRERAGHTRARGR